MQPITMKWRGAEYTIPASRAFEIGERLERIVTIGEIGSWGEKVPFYTVARCYAEMLSYAGAKVTKEDVFTDIMSGLKGAASEGIPAVEAVFALVGCLMGGAPATDETETDTKTSAS
ncbi:MAG: hypothetical protein ACEQSU_15220 [Microgenomates group bacterium]